MRLDAVLHNFEIIGEAVRHLPAEFRDDHQDIPWRDIAGMRDIVAHVYFALDVDILWKGIREDVPTLLSGVEAIIRTEEPRQP